jgi:hypothetical protein
MVHGAKHGHSGSGVCLDSADEQLHAAGLARGCCRPGAGFIVGFRCDFNLRRGAGPRAGSLQAVRRTVAELGSGLAPLFGGYLANTFNPGVPFLFYAPLLAVSATLLAVVGKETLER